MEKVKIRNKEFSLEDKDAALILVLKELIGELRRIRK